MTTILNASTSAGLIITPDTSGNIQLQYNGVAAPAFSAYANSGTNVPNVTWTKILYDTELFDTNNNFASSRFTPTVAGYYQINGNGRFSNAVAGSTLYFGIYKNGVQYTLVGSGAASTPRAIQAATLMYMNGTTDYVEFWAYQNSGGTEATDTGSQYTFSGCLLRGA